MLSGLEGPWAGKIDSNTASVTRKSLDQRSRASLADIAVKNLDHASESLSSPDANSAIEQGDLRKMGQVQVEVDKNDGGNNQKDVKILESLVEGMSKNRVGLEHNGNEGAGTLGSQG